MPPRILLLQARNAGDPMREAERRSFAEKCGLEVEAVVPHDLLVGPPDLEALRRHDAVMVGGSGDYSISKRNLPHWEAIAESLVDLVDEGRPTLASCFGYHCLVEALGGRIVADPERMEVGTYEVALTAEGAADELFGALPPRFNAQMGHQDRAERPAPGTVNLAASELCPYQALRLPGKPIWATQFHPELDRETNRERYLRYIEAYSEHLDEEARERQLKRFHPSVEAEMLPRRFLELVL